MADAVNPQIIDSVTAANAKSLGDGPAIAMDIVYQSLAQAISLSFQNAVSSQQRMNEIANVATAAILKDLTSIDPEEAISTAKELSVGTDLPTVIAQLGTALGSLQQFIKTAQTTPPETGKVS
jgi:hypothetical protein